MSEPGELLRTEDINGSKFEYRRGANAAYPIEVWRGEQMYGRFEHGPLTTGGAMPRIEVSNIEDLMFRRDRVGTTIMQVRRVGALVWREASRRPRYPSASRNVWL